MTPAELLMTIVLLPVFLLLQAAGEVLFWGAALALLGLVYVAFLKVGDWITGPAAAPPPVPRRGDPVRP